MLLLPEKNKVLSTDSKGFNLQWEFPYEHKEKIENGFYEVWCNGKFVMKSPCIYGEKVWCNYNKPGLINIVIKLRQYDNLLADPIGIESDFRYISKRGLPLAANKKLAFINRIFGSWKNIFEKCDNISWYYNWTTTPTNGVNENMEFVPMIWGKDDISKVTKNYPIYLLFNEPDVNTKDGGSNIPPTTAANLFNALLLSQYETKFSLPSVAQAYHNEEGTWIRKFLSDGRFNIEDFAVVPIHCYYSKYGGAEGAQSFLKEIVDKTWELFRKPIWITEFGVSDLPYTEDNCIKVEEFMKEVLKGLDEREYVAKYAWFPANIKGKDGASALWDRRGRLTKLGRIWFDVRD